MPAPVHRLTKDKIIWLAKNKCRHSHSYLDHYSCYLDENPEEGKIGYFDIEVSNLKANMGWLLSYCILDDNDNVLGRAVTKKELMSKDADKKLVKECVNHLMQFDKVVTYYGTGFDIPFIRSRAVYHDIEFPEYGQLHHLDLYYIIRNKFQLTRNSLATACSFLLGSTEKTHISWDHWMRAVQGDKESLEYIYDHNVKDVRDTKRLHDKVVGFKKITSLSI